MLWFVSKSKIHSSRCVLFECLKRAQFRVQFRAGFGQDSSRVWTGFWQRFRQRFWPVLVKGLFKDKTFLYETDMVFIGAWFFTDIVQIYKFVDISLHAHVLMQLLWKPKSPQVMAGTRHTLNRNNLFTIMFNVKVETIENGLMESLLHKMNLTIMWKG